MFVAIDVETADQHHAHVCAIGVVRVERGRVVADAYRLVRPPCGIDRFNRETHGLTDDDVAGEPAFREVWRDLRFLLDGARFVGAHNAAFDRAALAKSCRAARLPAPVAPYRCTVQLARERWGIRPTSLPSVCERLGIPLGRHHHALDDARAVAEILIRAGSRS